tara:strand:+ start:59 stop:232 length:174 start_codon:yes stop_codon:yes gene_type:complete
MKYLKGQKFEDKYGQIVLQKEYEIGLWEVRRFSGTRIVGEVLMEEKQLHKLLLIKNK